MKAACSKHKTVLPPDDDDVVVLTENSKVTPCHDLSSSSGIESEELSSNSSDSSDYCVEVSPSTGMTKHEEELQEQADDVELRVTRIHGHKIPYRIPVLSTPYLDLNAVSTFFRRKECGSSVPLMLR